MTRKIPSKNKTTADSSMNGRRSWDVANERRFLLIEKEFSQGLSPEEQEELEQLQATMADRLATMHPLPFDRLEALEKAARERGRDPDKAEAIEPEQS